MSADFFNKGKKSGDLPPVPPQRTSREKELVAKALEQLKKEFPIRDSTDVDRLAESLLTGVKMVRAHLMEIDKALREVGKSNDRIMFRDEAQNQFLYLLSRYNKDELHLLFTIFLADFTIKEFV